MTFGEGGIKIWWGTSSGGKFFLIGWGDEQSNGVTPLSRKNPCNNDLETEKRNRSGFPRKTLVSSKMGKNGLK